MSTQREPIKTSRKDHYQVDPANIIIQDGFNVRDDYGDIEELAAQIQENGIITPLKGYKKGDQFILVDGHRRLRAVKHIFDTTGMVTMVPFMCKDARGGYSEVQQITDMLLSAEGKPLTTIEQAEAVNRMLKLGLKDAEIAKIFGKSLGTISNLKQLAKLGAKAKASIKEGKVTAEAAMKVVRDAKKEGTDASEQIDALTTESKSGKTVGLSAVKFNPAKFLKDMDRAGILPKKNVETYKVVQRILNGSITEQEMNDYFY